MRNERARNAFVKFLCILCLGQDPDYLIDAVEIDNDRDPVVADVNVFDIGNANREFVINYLQNLA